VQEHSATFPCFGSQCTVLVSGSGRHGDAAAAAAAAKARLLAWHDQFSRFQAGSELSRLNADPRATVPVSPLMGRLAEAAITAAQFTDGLVDATLVGEIERAGYGSHFDEPPVPLARALALAPPRAPAHAAAARRWREIEVDRAAGTVTRPPGLGLDSGGIAKGLFADGLAALLREYDGFAVDCGGDLRLGGAAGVTRPVQVASPFDDSILHTFGLSRGGVATSGIGKRSWLDAEGRPAHHLLDPSTGRPAFTGIVQVTALAPTAIQAEALSKATIIAGPEQVERWLAFGGAVVFDDASHRVLPARDL
jgi:thiamine biosynthesis lipoprotein